MLALWYFICPSGMYFNGSVIYFDINILTLVVLTVCCYGFIKLYEKLFCTRAPVNTVFTCTVIFEDKKISLKAFLDTGNNLRDYFADKPVIIADKSIFAGIFPLTSDMRIYESVEKIRYIFCDTVGGEGLLPAFSPDDIHIQGADYDFYTDRVMVALTDKKLFNGEFDAILPVGLFDNIFYGKDEKDDEKNSVKAQNDQE